MRTKLEAAGDYQQAILDYLENNASDSLVEKINAGKKTLADCWKFICDEVKKAAKGSSCVVMKDEDVYGMAVHFFEEDGIQPGKAAAVKEMPRVVRPEGGIPGAGVKTKAKLKVVKGQPKQGVKKTEAKKPEAKKPEEDNQLSFDDLFAAGGIWA